MLIPIIWSIEEFFWAGGREYRDEYKDFCKIWIMEFTEQQKMAYRYLEKLQTARGAHKCENKHLIYINKNIV